MTPAKFHRLATKLVAEEKETLEKYDNSTTPDMPHVEERRRRIVNDFVTRRVKLMGQCLIENGFEKGYMTLG
jgi:hypothetical protein